MKIRSLFLVLSLFFIAEDVFSQSYLVLRKKGSRRKYEYFVGDTFVYKQKGQEVFFTDRITGFADSTIVLENNILRTNQIEEVDIRNAESNRSKILNSMESYLPSVGILLISVDFINIAVVEGESYRLNEGVTITSAALIGTGLGLKLMRRKFIKLTNPRFEAFVIQL